MGHEETGIRQPIKAYQETKKKGLDFEQLTTGGISKDGHTFLNFQNKIIEVKDIHEEVEKKAYDDILDDDISFEDSILHELSIYLIDLPLTHPKLIDWN